jgi:serine/threonine protein kinase
VRVVDLGLVNERYRLDTLIARGGMGEVWQAYDLTLRRTVAVKVLAAGAGTPTERQRFAREAQSAAQLSHPNVVAVYDFGEWDGRPYLVMELLAGETLSGLLAARGPLPVEQVRDLGAQVCAALQAAHAAGVVHRDIKPSNLILTPDGVLKVVDFGIAGVVDDASTRLTQAGTVVGTAAYLAPERIEGSTADAASDLYAVGCVLYELLCGSTPFTGSMTTMAYAHVHHPPQPPSVHRADVPADLEGLLLSLLAKDPRQRPTAAAARTALREPATQVMAAGPPPLPVPERNRTPWVIGGAAALVVLGVVGLLIWNGANDPASLAEPGGTTPTVETTSQPPPSTPAQPTATTTPTPTPNRETQRPPFGSRAWFVAFDRQLSRLTPGENIDADVYRKLDELTDKGIEAHDEGREARARKYARDLIREVGDAWEKGNLELPTGLLRDLLDQPGQDSGGQDNDGGDKGEDKDGDD